MSERQDLERPQGGWLAGEGWVPHVFCSVLDTVISGHEERAGTSATTLVNCHHTGKSGRRRMGREGLEIPEREVDE